MSFLSVRRSYRRAGGLFLALCILIGAIGSEGTALGQGPTEEQILEQRNSSWISEEMEGVDTFWKAKWSQVARKSVLLKQVEERKKLTQVSERLVQKYQESNLFWGDPVIDDYLQRALLEVHSKTTIPGWGGSLQIRVLQASLPNAIALYDGTILVSAGLLAELRSRDELLAIIAHEVAHLAEDHSFEAYKSRKNREQIAKVLGGIAGAAAGATLGASAAEDGATAQSAANIARSVTAASIALADDIAEAVGAEYNRDQEKQADRLAQRWVLESSVEVGALASALTRVEKNAVLKGRASRQTFLSSHPSYGRRVSMLREVVGEDGDLFAAGVPLDPSSEYDQKIAPLLENEAERRIVDGRHESAIDLLNRVIDAGSAAPRTYLLKAIALRHARNTEEASTEVVDLLTEYKEQGGERRPQYFLELGLINMRLDRDKKAAEAFRKCAEALSEAEEPSLVRMRERAEAMSKRLGPNTAATEKRGQ